MQNNLVWLVLLIALMYFMIIRPQQKQKKQRQDLLDSLTVGVDIITIGGIHGKIVSMTENDVVIVISPGVEIVIQRSAVGVVVTETIEEEKEPEEIEEIEQPEENK